MTVEILSKSGITRDDIETLLADFYQTVRADTLLGPVFESRVGPSDQDWEPHISKIADFWANVMLKERAYSGNPMQVHLSVPEIGATHFERWLDLFEASAHKVLPATKAASFNVLARRIGRSLLMGLTQARGGVPVLG